MKKLEPRRLTVELNSMALLSNLTPDKVETLKEDLTFVNPKYDQAMKYSKWEYTTIDENLFYFDRHSPNSFSVPIGYNFWKFSPKKVIDNRVKNLVQVPEFLLELREHQKDAVEKYFSLNKTEKPYFSIQLKTGKGKTVLGLYIASKLKQKTLIVVHKDDLIRGWRKDIEKCFGKMRVGLIKAQSRVIGDFITLATVQTLSKLPEKEIKKLYKEFGFVIQDEMHIVGAGYVEVANKFPARYKLGLSATPERKDGLQQLIFLNYGEYAYTDFDKEDGESILPVKIIPVYLPKIIYNPLCKKHRKNGKERYRIVDLVNDKNKADNKRFFNYEDIDYFKRPEVRYREVDNFAVKNMFPTLREKVLYEYSRGKSCLIFFSLKEHVEEFKEFLLDEVPEKDIGCYYGNNKRNDLVLDTVEKRRKFITIATYAKATEGTNAVQWEVAFLASSINSGKNVEQAIGRIRRYAPNKDGVVRVYDFRPNNLHIIKNHAQTRDTRYRKLKFSIEGEKSKNKLFKRGF